MPLCYGGGITNKEDALKILSLGVEKISISSSAIKKPVLIDEIAESAVDDTTKNIILRAGNSLDEARRTYNEGAKIFEDIEDAGIIKNLKLKADGNMSIGLSLIHISEPTRPEGYRMPSSA